MRSTADYNALVAAWSEAANAARAAESNLRTLEAQRASAAEKCQSAQAQEAAALKALQDALPPTPGPTPPTPVPDPGPAPTPAPKPATDLWKWLAILGLGLAVSFNTYQGCSKPQPPGPTPPGPTPPGPGPIPVPVPTGDLRVLMVTDPSDTSMPAAQSEVLYSAQVRDWLNAHTPLGPDGKTHEWRLWPIGIDTTAEATHWQELYKRADKPPCLVISKGTTVDVVPMPPNVDEAMKVLGKYVG